MAIVDDTATANAPIMSPDMFKEFFLPLYDRQASSGETEASPYPITTAANARPCWSPWSI
jgi:hypothetical protein